MKPSLSRVVEGPIGDVLAGRARYCVVEGDCLEVLPLLGVRSVAHCISDPPYRRALYEGLRTNKGARGREATSVQTRNRMALASMAIGALEDVIDDAAKELLRLVVRWVVVFQRNECQAADGTDDPCRCAVFELKAEE